MTRHILAAHGLHFHRRDRQVLHGVDLTLTQGEVVSLLGANGAGKTTLLRLLLGFEKPRSGAVTLDGLALTAMKRRDVARRVAYVPQAHAAPFPYLVRDVVMLGRLPLTGLFRAPGTEDHAIAQAMLERLGIAALAQRAYTQLSGGERQLVLIARALAQEAKLLVMDEPLTGLDYGNQLRLLDCLLDLAAEGFGILLTTHHPDHAANSSTRVAMLADGRIIHDGAPDQVVTPDSIHHLYGVRVREDRRLFRPQDQRR